MAPSPASTPKPAPRPAQPEWVWRDASDEGVVGSTAQRVDNKR